MKYSQKEWICPTIQTLAVSNTKTVVEPKTAVVEIDFSTTTSSAVEITFDSNAVSQLTEEVIPPAS